MPRRAGGARSSLRPVVWLRFFGPEEAAAAAALIPSGACRRLIFPRPRPLGALSWPTDTLAAERSAAQGPAVQGGSEGRSRAAGRFRSAGPGNVPTSTRHGGARCLCADAREVAASAPGGALDVGGGGAASAAAEAPPQQNEDASMMTADVDRSGGSASSVTGGLPGAGLTPASYFWNCLCSGSEAIPGYNSPRIQKKSNILSSKLARAWSRTGFRQARS